MIFMCVPFQFMYAVFVLWYDIFTSLIPVSTNLAG